MATRIGMRTPAQGFSLTFGVLYLAIGLLGFAVTGLEDVAGRSGATLIVFELNPLHNVVHIAIGAGWLVASERHGRSKATNLVVGGLYVAVALLGFLGVIATLLSLNAADDVLHLITGALALYFGTLGAEAPETAVPA